MDVGVYTLNKSNNHDDQINHLSNNTYNTIHNLLRDIKIANKTKPKRNSRRVKKISKTIFDTETVVELVEDPIPI